MEKLSELKRSIARVGLKKLLFGFLIGIINGFLGAGGGMLAVPALRKLGLEGKEAHSSSVAVILPLSVFSLIAYLFAGSVRISDGTPYIISGLIGAGLGTYLLSKIPDKALRKIFAVFMIYAGGRLILR